MALGVIISPAKKMNVVEGPPYVTALPRHVQRSQELLGRLQSLPYDEAKALWRCSDRLARLNFERLRTMDLARDLTAAVLAYEGIQYQHLAASVLDEDGLDWIDAHLSILSGLYGVLRPFDGVVPYRLEIQARLATPATDGRPATSDLYGFWGDTLARTLAEAFDLVVNVASVEYAKAVTPYLPSLGVHVITCLFGTVRSTDGKLLQRSTEAKAARGTFVRWCAERGVTDRDQLREFADRGYHLDKSRSDQDTLVFVRG
ncbi:MAG: peroxide stress protein YaaA [Atopobiaceae bacterium]|nr:peroxide stress protein YaaA [Atopobiaceae bacterium]